jgi:hypothetical protein
LDNTVVSINIRDNADEFRVEITGRFAGTVVDDVLYLWKSVVRDGNSRRFTIDITQLTGYDFGGCSLLMDMQKYGVYISAGSALSLVFLSEISNPRRKLGPSLVRKRPSLSELKPRVAEYPLIPIAAGE